jgi:hypothetical protein
MRMPSLILAALLAASALHAIDRQVPGALGHTPPPPSSGIAGVPNGILEIDRNEDGIVDYKVFNDARGRVAREELDFNFDGKMDTFYFYRDGQLEREEIDSDFDGGVDIWVHIIQGKYIERYERDTNGDGKPDLVKVFGT